MKVTGYLLIFLGSFNIVGGMIMLLIMLLADIVGVLPLGDFLLSDSLFTSVIGWFVILPLTPVPFMIFCIGMMILDYLALKRNSKGVVSKQ
jgi:hypothetical protein